MRKASILLFFCSVCAFAQSKEERKQTIYQFVNEYLKGYDKVILEQEAPRYLNCADVTRDQEMLKMLEKRLSKQDYDHVVRQYGDTASWYWQQDLLGNVKVMSAARITAVLGESRNAWRSWRIFKSKYGTEVYTINRPLLTLNSRDIIVSVTNFCGSNCLKRSLRIYTRKDGGWQEVEVLCYILM